ncbi:hypothetical protein EYB25_007442 [Talaromyces marneffei]|uniref:Putative pectate lyase C n=1 Tax=Talaromyces marneffei PM1 TaxID=1077442 RepID=A0A093UY90_TALMA|nr:hypothetical protein EYB25_007442 [Talaromyces marneffei]
MPPKQWYWGHGAECPRLEKGPLDITSNIILGHCSVEYGQWDSVDTVGSVNTTVSNSIIALPIGQQFGAHVETRPATFYGNLWVSAHNHQPLAKSNTQRFNNVVYNFQAAYTVSNTSEDSYHDIINNHFIVGPSTTSSSDASYQINSGQIVYATGNYLGTNKDGTLNGAAYNTVGSATVANTALEEMSLIIVAVTAAQAYTSLITKMT